MKDDDQNQIGSPALIQTHADKIVIHTEPRISANKLAEYVTADPYRQKAILRDSKYAKTVLVVPYKRTRAYIPYAFSSTCLDIDMLVTRAKEIESENESPDISDWLRSDNTNSAAALRYIATVAPELSW